MQPFRVKWGNLKYGVIWNVSLHATKIGTNCLIIHHNQAQYTTIGSIHSEGGLVQKRLTKVLKLLSSVAKNYVVHQHFSLNESILAKG